MVWLPTWHFFSTFATKILYVFVKSVMRATCSVHLAFLDLMIIYSERCPITLLIPIISISPMGQVCG